MRIACVSTARVPSNTANSIQVMKVCQALGQLGHSVNLAVPADPDLPPADWPSLAERYGLDAQFPIDRISPPAGLGVPGLGVPRLGGPGLGRNLFAWQAVTRAREAGAALLYTWTVQSAVFAQLAGIPTLLELHDGPTGRLGPLWLRLYLSLPGKKRLAIITRALANALQARFPRLGKHSIVIAPNGVDLERFTRLPEPALARDQLALPQALTVACTGHLYAGRGGELFLSLAKQFLQASFLWVGGRPEDVAVFQDKARISGVPNVTFTGFIPNRQLPLYQAAADILLMPYARRIAGSSGGNSSDICSPMKLFEYLAAGRAILATDLPVFHEILNENNALFCTTEDEPAWQAALSRLMEDLPLRQRLSTQARRDAQLYTWREREQRCLQGS